MAARLTVVTNSEQVGEFPSERLILLFNAAMFEAEPEGSFCAGCARAKAYRLPIHKAFYDGRSDHDWHLSVIDYLRWRAGSSWRPARHSGLCLVDNYRDALHVVSQAFHSTVSQAPLTAQRKAPVSVSVAEADRLTQLRSELRCAVAGEGVA